MSRASAAAAGACASAFAALAGLVAAGELTGIDEWAVQHAMPGAHFAGKPTFADAVVPLLGAHWHPALDVVANVVTAPASFTVSLLIVALACTRLPRRTAIALGGAFVAGNVVEVVVKAALTRPALHAHGARLSGFLSSYPSGHTIRTILVALAVTLAWPRLVPVAALWAPASLALLLLAGEHVPSDIAGGLLVGGALVATTWSSRCSTTSTSRSPSTACRPSSREP